MPDPKPRPNLLLITTDQQRFDALGRAGNRSIFTPHLNWLCDTGIRFTRGYSDCPICMPARATMMTGRHGYNQGLIENKGTPVPAAEHPTLPGLLTQAGYQTRAVGKMHFSPVRAHYGFEHMELPFDYYRTMQRDGFARQVAGPGLGQNEMEPAFSTVDEGRSLTRWIADRSIDFLETRDTTRPFFMWTSFTKPHPPFDCDPKYWHLYDGIPMPDRVTGDWSATPDDVPVGFRGPTALLNGIDRASPAQLAATRRAYFACVSQVDYNLGLLFARLRELDLDRDTWIVFTSDHGEMLGDHWLGAKSVLFEPSAHVPLIVKPPATPWESQPMQGTTCDALACLADVLPTLLARAGVELPGGVDGIDLMQQAAGDARRERLFGSCSHYAAVVEDRLKYHRCVADGAELLFDLHDDPMEQQDLLRAGGHGDDADRLRGLLQDEVLAPLGRSLEAERGDVGLPKNRWPGYHSRSVESDVLH